MEEKYSYEYVTLTHGNNIKLFCIIFERENVIVV